MIKDSIQIQDYLPSLCVVVAPTFLVNDVKNLSFDGLFMIYLKSNNKITIYIKPILNVGVIYIYYYDKYCSLIKFISSP